MAKDKKKKDEIKTKKRGDGYFWYIPEEGLVKTIVIALKKNLTAKEFRDILETNTENHPQNKRTDKTVHPLSLAQATSRFRTFKKEYGYKHLKFRRDKLTKDEAKKKLQDELKAQYGEDLAQYNKK